MKNENKKAMNAKRIANRKQTIVDLEACVARLRGEGAAKDKKIAELETLLKAARDAQAAQS